MFFFFFFNDTATTEIYTLSLHDALPISPTASDSEPAVDDSDGLSDSTAETSIAPAVENAGDPQEASPTNDDPDPARPMNEAAADAERP